MNFDIESKVRELKNNKICLITSNLGIGGVGRNMINLANIYSKWGIEVDLYLVNREQGIRLKEVDENVNCIQGSGHARTELFPLIKYLNDHKPDLVISGPSRINPLVILAKKICLQKQIMNIATYRTHRTTEIKHIETSFRKLLEYVSSKLYQFSDKIVCVSEGVKKDFVESLKLDEEKVDVIYNPAWSNDFLEKISKPKHPWLLNDDLPVAIACGRLEVAKDYDTMLKSIAILKDKRPVRLLIIGDGKEKERLIHLSNNLKVDHLVDFLGYKNNPLDYMIESDLFLLTSKWEGFGNVLVEALGVGLPIVSTDCKSGPAEILNYGEFGALVPTENPDEVAKKIIEVLNLPRNKEKQKLRANNFSDEISAFKYLELYSENKK